jgi:hypothetical protein
MDETSKVARAIADEPRRKIPHISVNVIGFLPNNSRIV